MPDTRHYRDSAHARNPEQTKHRLTPGSQPWKAAVIRDLRNGYGVEDVALRLDCDVKHVRAVVAKLRRLGLLPALYEEARETWKPIAEIAKTFVDKAGGAR